jgi:hypothetical protein
MTHAKRTRFIVTAELYALVVGLLLLTSCSAIKRVFGTEYPASSYVAIYGADGVPIACMLYDGNAVLAKSDGSIEAEMWLKDNGASLAGLEPTGHAGMLFKQRKPDIEWSGGVDDRAPAAASTLFEGRPGLAAKLGVALEPAP